MANTDAMSEAPAAASELIEACERAWRSIQHQQPGVPDVVIVLGTGVERGRLVKLGHWWGGRWMADGQVRGEVLLAGEALHLQPSQVFEVLLHEAAHGLNAARGVQDASRGGRYHNGKFKSAAEELGLVVTSMPPYGWAHTALGPNASKVYEPDISRLGDAMRIARRLGANVRLGEADRDKDQDQSETEGQTTGDAAARPGRAACGCGRKMRMTPSVLAQGPVLCGLCGHEFSTERLADKRAGRGQAAAPSPNGRADQLNGGGAPRTFNDVQISGLEHLTALAAAPRGIELIAEVGAWRQAHRQGDPSAILVTSPSNLSAANDAARALLKLEGELSGRPMLVAGRELLVGELLVVGEHADAPSDLDGRELPPAGVLGTIVDIDPDVGVVTIDFPIAGKHRVGGDSHAAALLEYGYAEEAAFVGAPIVDLRTLRSLDVPPAVERRNVPELSW
ncbi:MAG: hypothetical protein AB7V43_16310 [Acidimicrobiia bacterium]